MPVFTRPALLLQLAGTTSEKVAEQLGCTSTYVSQMFNGRCRPTARLIEAIASLTDRATADEIARELGIEATRA